jgi:hypothetical protein
VRDEAKMRPLRRGDDTPQPQINLAAQKMEQSTYALGASPPRRNGTREKSNATHQGLVPDGEEVVLFADPACLFAEGAESGWWLSIKVGGEGGEVM